MKLLFANDKECIKKVVSVNFWKKDVQKKIIIMKSCNKTKKLINIISKKDLLKIMSQWNLSFTRFIALIILILERYEKLIKF